jgi:hypothetical protein
MGTPPQDSAVEIAIIVDVFPPVMPALTRKFYRRFVRTLNTKVYDLAVKMGITIGCPVNPVVVNGCKSNETPISLLFFPQLTFLQPRLPPPFWRLPC